jgi:type II secretory pathway component PulJ
MKFEIKDTNQQRQERQKKSLKGFTLLELLVSMTITLVIVGLLMGMTKMGVPSSIQVDQCLTLPTRWWAMDGSS